VSRAVPDPAPRRQRLDARLIVDTALTLASSQGTEAVTVRRLGQELGADATAMYRYFRGKDELLLMMADRLLEMVQERVPRAARWQDYLAAFGRGLVSVFVEYPAVGAVIASRTTRRGSEITAVETLLSVMKEAGLNDDDAVLYYRAFVDFLLSFAGMQAQYALLDPAERDADESSWEQVYGNLPPGQYPNIARTAPRLAAITSDEILRIGLQAIIQAIALRAAELPPQA
jgi:AcrR family transcriptional regulator